MEKVYFIKSECNDHGWLTGYYYFKKKEDAITTMRRYVARQIWRERKQGNKVEYLKVWRDVVMGSMTASLVKEESITITFKVTTKKHETFFWEFRIWCADFLDKPLATEQCFNF